MGQYLPYHMRRRTNFLIFTDVQMDNVQAVSLNIIILHDITLFKKQDLNIISGIIFWTNLVLF